VTAQRVQIVETAVAAPGAAVAVAEVVINSKAKE